MVWKLVATPGQQLAPGETVMILESMKMEIPVIAEDGGRLVTLLVAEGEAVAEGAVVAMVEE
jgi:biotin carboxyl carrier protein